MKARLGALVVVPTLALIVLASILVDDRNGSYDEARRGSSVNRLATDIAELDQALGEEAIASSLSLPGFGGSESATERGAVERTRSETDRKLSDLDAQLAQLTRPTKHLVEASRSVDLALRFRSDVEAGVVSPLQIADRYGTLRTSLLEALSAEVEKDAVLSGNRPIDSLVSLIRARSAHLDERFILQLAIIYQTWAPGQHGALLSRIAEGELWLDLADGAEAANGLSKAKPEQLLASRQSAMENADVPSVGIDVWLASSDEWLEALDQAIVGHGQRSTVLFTEAELDAQQARATMVLALVLVVSATVGMGALLALRLVGHLRRFSLFADAVATGDFTGEDWSPDGRHDEIGDLARSLTRMTESLATKAELRIAVLESIVRGDPKPETLGLAAQMLDTDHAGKPRHRFELASSAPTNSTPSSRPTEPTRLTDRMPEPTPPLRLVEIDTGEVWDPPASSEARAAFQLALMAHQHEAWATELTEHATRDALTGLLNRRAILAELGAALHAGTETTVLYLDLDKFKPINDQYGHDAGDQVLRIQGTRLSQFAALTGGFAGRIGGDEFLLVIPQASASAIHRMVTANLLPSLAREIDVRSASESIGVQTTACVGLATSEPGEEMASLLAAADAALYAAKGTGRSCCAMGGAEVPVIDQAPVPALGAPA